MHVRVAGSFGSGAALSSTPSMIATSLTLFAIGPAVSWSAVIGITPYRLMRPTVGLILLVAGIVTLDWPWLALLPAACYTMIHIAEGEIITPLLLAKRLTLNPVLVIVSLFFWHALWGIPGALQYTGQPAAEQGQAPLNSTITTPGQKPGQPRTSASTAFRLPKGEGGPTGSTAVPKSRGTSSTVVLFE